VLTANRLTRRFGDRVAVEQLSFELHRGEIFALLGPNGAGKTTTLRMLAGLITPTSGGILVGNEPLSHRNAARLRQRIGFLTEAPGLWDRLSVRRNLQVYAQLYQIAEPGRAVDDALDLFGIRNRADDPAAQLSKGLKQRVALARTLLHKPDAVLLDEPTSGLDPESARDVRDLVLTLREQGRTVVLSTHNLDEVDRVADRVAVIRGKLIALDTPAQLRTTLFGARIRVVVSSSVDAAMGILRTAGFRDIRAGKDEVSIGVNDARSAAPGIVRRLSEAGAQIVSVTPEEPPLEDPERALGPQTESGAVSSGCAHRARFDHAALLRGHRRSRIRRRATVRFERFRDRAAAVSRRTRAGGPQS
jgi:ABC-2 type transport system ATP-binding protein